MTDNSDLKAGCSYEPAKCLLLIGATLVISMHPAWIAERAEGKKGAEDYDPEAYVTAMFAGKKAILVRLCDKLLQIGLGLGDDVKACPCKTIVPLYRNHVFAEIKPSTNSRIDLGFALGKEVKAKGRLLETGGAAKGDRITHRIPITKLDEIDAEVMSWLEKAYQRDGST